MVVDVLVVENGVRYESLYTNSKPHIETVSIISACLPNIALRRKALHNRSRNKMSVGIPLKHHLDRIARSEML